MTDTPIGGPVSSRCLVNPDPEARKGLENKTAFCPVCRTRTRLTRDPGSGVVVCGRCSNPHNTGVPEIAVIGREPAGKTPYDIW